MWSSPARSGRPAGLQDTSTTEYHVRPPPLSSLSPPSGPDELDAPRRSPPRPRARQVTPSTSVAGDAGLRVAEEDLLEDEESHAFDIG